MAILPIRWLDDGIEPGAAAEGETCKLLDSNGVPLCVGLGLVVQLIPVVGRWAIGA